MKADDLPRVHVDERIEQRVVVRRLAEEIGVVGETDEVARLPGLKIGRAHV